MARVHFGSGMVHELYCARDPFTSELIRVSIYQETLVIVYLILITSLIDHLH